MSRALEDRTIDDAPARAASAPDAADLEGSDAGALRGWIEARAREHPDMRWLLAHADDGVIWGRIDAGSDTLVTSREAAQGDDEALRVCPPLRPITLQQARLFGEKGELLLWRDGGRRFRARLIRKANSGNDPDWTESLDERQMLWGDAGRALKHDFFLWREGAEGLRHALPFPRGYFGDAGGDADPPRLVVRHYLNGEGLARIAASRLVAFEPDN